MVLTDPIFSFPLRVYPPLTNRITLPTFSVQSSPPNSPRTVQSRKRWSRVTTPPSHGGGRVETVNLSVTGYLGAVPLGVNFVSTVGRGG